ncbi:MAG: type II toxin-antitoxin system prevent-host-death family antitoxin [Verrucomicrobiota bacterium]|nr:type II toxin-antitoxin system prevent-host-death family antitoxin [Verrucomicrobiota bacterium]
MMKASLIDIRRSPGRILDAVEKRETVILSRRGKPFAKISPLAEVPAVSSQAHVAFGMWKDRDQASVHDQVRNLRKGRFHGL